MFSLGRKQHFANSKILRACGNPNINDGEPCQARQLSEPQVPVHNTSLSGLKVLDVLVCQLAVGDSEQNTRLEIIIGVSQMFEKLRCLT